MDDPRHPERKPRGLFTMAMLEEIALASHGEVFRCTIVQKQPCKAEFTVALAGPQGMPLSKQALAQARDTLASEVPGYIAIEVVTP